MLIEDFEAIKSRRSANIVLEIIMIVPDNIKQVLPPPSTGLMDAAGPA